MPKINFERCDLTVEMSLNSMNLQVRGETDVMQMNINFINCYRLKSYNPGQDQSTTLTSINRLQVGPSIYPSFYKNLGYYVPKLVHIILYKQML